MPTFRISRRAVLKGTLGGAAISFGLPPLEAMFNANGTALAQGGALPKRLGIFFWGGGVKHDRWDPVEPGAVWTPTSELAPLLPVKDYINVVTGHDVKTGNFQGHHSGAAGILSGVPLKVQPAGGAPYRSTMGGPTIDQLAATQIGAMSKFKSLEVGISRRINGAEGTTLQYLSHNAGDSPNPPIYDPGAVYDRIFMGFVPPTGGGMPVTDATIALRKSVMDAVLADINSLKLKVSTFDKVRLDQHLTNIRTIENRLDMTKPTIAGVGCVKPARPAAITDTNNRELLEERTTIMGQLLAIAFACDLTRVFSMMYSGPTNSTVFWQAGASGGHHDLTHNEGTDQPLVHACTIFTMKCFASLLGALKATPEGAGNLLDNSAIYASSDVSDGKAHSQTNYPLLVAGGGGGYLKYPGIHYKSLTKENTNNVLLTVLRAAGCTMPSLGTTAMAGLTTVGCTAIEKA